MRFIVEPAFSMAPAIVDVDSENLLEAILRGLDASPTGEVRVTTCKLSSPQGTIGDNTCGVEPK